MTSFALFRLPYAQECTLIEQTSGEPVELMSCAELTGQQGFVLAPFAPSTEHPILVLRPDSVTTASVDSLTEGAEWPKWAGVLRTSPSDYHLDFTHFHAHLLNGDFQKLVLSRSITIEKAGDETPLQLFQRACACYPRMLISLVCTPKSGLWLAATPEILLAGEGNEWQTIALAGTMKYEEHLQWSEKNVQEQRYVAAYITRQLEQFTNNFTEGELCTARAGHLAHLRSDFHFSLPEGASVGELLQALHPTPAVCGLPKHEAFRFILQHEGHDRSYYSGFMGPLLLEGKTHLFVTLRCMQLFANGYRLYAGGGLLRDSIEEQEWQETETKLDTMRHIIYNNV